MKLITGRAGTGKTYTCLEQINKFFKEAYDKPLIYIVPEQFSFEAEKKLIDVTNGKGIIGLQVLSFKRLAHKIFEEENFNKNYMEASGKAMLMYFIMTENDKKLNVLKNVSKNTGLVDTVVEMIDEFKRYNITPDMLENININNEYLKLKLQDLYLLYSELENRIKDKYLDINDELTVLSNLLDNSNYLDGAKIWIDEFDGFTPQELNVIKKLDKKCDITIAITTDNMENDLFLLNNKNIKKLNKICTDVHIINLEKTFRFQNDELKHLEQNLFKYPYKMYDKDVKNIFINYSANQYSEIESVACKIINLVKEKNIRYDNIAVLTRDLDFYKNLIGKIFMEYDIPYFLDNKKELYREPLMLLITSLLDICSNNFSYESMFSYLKTGLTNIEDMNDIDIIENYVLKYGIKGNVWLRKWELEDKNLEKINIIRENIITPIFNFKNELSNKKTIKDMINAIYNFLIQNGVYENIEKYIEKLKLKGEIKIANEYSQVWNQLMNIFDEMYNSLVDTRISYESFKNIFKIGISEHSISTIPTTSDQVIIGDSSRTKNSNIKCLFIIGLNDGAFPKNFSSEGFINDNERNLLLDAGIEIAKDTKMLLLEENFNIYKAFTSVSNSIYMYSPVSNLEGISLRPSPVITQIKRIFPKLIEINDEFAKSKNDVDLITTPNATITILLKNLKNMIDGKKVLPMWKTVYDWYKNNFENFENIEKAIDYKNTVEYISKTNAKNLYGSIMNTSVSRLEKFENCPFSFYLRYGLNLKEREIYKLAAPDIGSFLHEIIEKFSKYIIDNNIDLRSIDRDIADEIIEKIVKEEMSNFKSNLFNSSEKMKRLGAKLSRLTKRMIWIIIFHIRSGKFNIAGSEVEFGDGKEYPAIEIELNEENKIKLRGKIDRIDVLEAEDGKYIRIVDYKSSDKALKLSNVYYGIQLQLLTYMDVVSKDAKPAGAFYLKLDNPIIKNNKDMSNEDIESQIIKSLRMNGLVIADAKLIKSMDENIEKESEVLNLSQKKDGTYSKMPVATSEQFEDLINHINKTLKDIGNEIISGNIKNEPIKRKNRTPCEYCEYYTICQFSKDLGNKYKLINDLNDEVVFNKINKT